MKILEIPSSSVRETTRGSGPRPVGALIINADDWGRDRENTDRILECAFHGAVSSVSGMVFMKDSARAAAIARDREIDTGLHLNFTTPFSVVSCPTKLIEHQHRICKHLMRHRLAPLVYHPGLVRSFEYVVSSQLNEFCRLYGTAPKRIDGHHHMHLCANVLFDGLLPEGTIARRNFFFLRGEKSVANRMYRELIDRKLARRCRLADFLFSLAPTEPATRLQRIFSYASQYFVEVETHPVNPQEFRFLAGGEVFRRIGDLDIADSYCLPM
jgi:predicted glycoside hydrolase/deacetylase ChbG (UPF0249 family)